MEEQKRDMTAATIYFRRHDRKMLEMIVFVANLAGDEGIDIYHLAKVFFYAEKRHLNQYWRPIVGDIYIKMPYGPGPSAVLDLINMLEMIDRDDMLDRFKRKFDQKLIELAQDALLVERNDKGHNEIKAKRQPNEDYLSESDKEAINWAYKRYAARSFNALMDESHQEQINFRHRKHPVVFCSSGPESHQEPAWRKAADGREMDYADMIEEGPHKKELVKHLEEDAPFFAL